MSKVMKQMQMDDTKRLLTGVRDLVVLSLNKLDSLGEYTLRKNLRGKKIMLRQVKNTITRKVFKELNLSVPDDSPVWAQPSVLAFSPVQTSIKDLSQTIEAELKGAKTAAMYKDKVTIKGAVADGQACTFEQALKMPTRTEVIGQIVGMIMGPASQIAGCLMGPASQVASQVQQVSEKKEEAAPAAQ